MAPQLSFAFKTKIDIYLDEFWVKFQGSVSGRFGDNEV